MSLHNKLLFEMIYLSGCLFLHHFVLRFLNILLDIIDFKKRIIVPISLKIMIPTKQNSIMTPIEPISCDDGLLSVALIFLLFAEIK
jgi:acetone carboxylase gamma subunit